MLKKLIISLLLSLFLLTVAQAQFHPSITPVLRSTNISIGPFLIEEPNRVVAGAGDMWLGVVDTITKEIIHDTSYFDPGCPFGGNGMFFIAKHPKGGYISSGILDECGRSIAIVLWTDTAMNEIASYKAPYYGYEETEAIFLNATVDPETGLTYAIKYHNQPLQTSDDKPVVLYTFDDSLHVLRQDTLAMSHHNGVRFDIDIEKKLLVYNHSHDDWDTTQIIKGFDIDTYEVIFEHRLNEFEITGDLMISNDGYFIVKTDFSSYMSSIEKIDFNGDLIDQVVISDSNTYSIGLFSHLLLLEEKLCLIHWISGIIVNDVGDTIIYRDQKLDIYSTRLEPLVSISLTHKPLFYDGVPSNYFFSQIISSYQKESSIYYGINLQPEDSSRSIYFLNRIDLDFLTSTQSADFTVAQPTIKCYPNPAKEVLYVDYPTYMLKDKPTYQLIDLSGRVLVSGKLTPAIPLTNLPKGTFILHIKNSQHHLLADPQLFIHL